MTNEAGRVPEDAVSGPLAALAFLGVPGDAPDRVRRRMIAINVISVFVAPMPFLYGVIYFVSGYPGMGMLGVVTATLSILYLAAPFFHRFGEPWAALWFIAVWLTSVAFASYALGREAGIHFYFLPGATTFVFFGPEHLKRAFVTGATALLLFFVVEFGIPEPAPFVAIDPEFLTWLRVSALVGSLLSMGFCVAYPVWLAANAEEALEMEYGRSERLLENVLPASIAKRLKAEPRSIIADELDDVTILFADIVDFTPRAADLGASGVIEFLNRIFTTFDDLARKHGLEKIKTIGDAYMVAGGMPNRSGDHAEAVAGMALDIVAATHAISEELGEQVKVRIGIHTGPAIAGVIGTQKHSYDVWGDTVNTAARLEGDGEPGRIQVTASTRDALKERFTLVRRGTRQIKGKGPTETWWLTGRRPAARQPVGTDRAAGPDFTP